MHRNLEFILHWAPNTMVIIPDIAKNGCSPFIAYGANANFGMAGAAFAIFLRSKNKNIYQMTQELVLHGYIPVFAHVERYGALADLQLAEELRNLGAWITVNADAVLGLEGMGPKKYCKKMLKAECVDAIASDSHGIKNRANHMGKCYELIEKKFGREYADQLLVNHPAKILTGEMK